MFSSSESCSGADRVAGLGRGPLERHRVHALGEHREALVDHRADHPRGVEAAAVVDHDRGLADLLHARRSALASASSEVFSPRMISTSGILSTGEKKCRPMKSSGRSTPVGELGDRQRRGVGAQQRVGVRRTACDLGEHLVLQRRVLEDRLDHQVAAGQVGRVGGRGDPGEQLGLLLLGRACRARSPCRAASRCRPCPSRRPRRRRP